MSNDRPLDDEEIDRIADAVRKKSTFKVYMPHDSDCERHEHLDKGEIREFRTMLTLMKWMAGILGTSCIALAALICTMVLAYGDLQRAKSDVASNNKDTKDSIEKVQSTVSSMQNSNAAMQASQTDLVQKVDNFGRLIENLDRRVAAHNKQEDNNP